MAEEADGGAPLLFGTAPVLAAISRSRFSFRSAASLAFLAALAEAVAFLSAADDAAFLSAAAHRRRDPGRRPRRRPRRLCLLLSLRI